MFLVGLPGSAPVSTFVRLVLVTARPHGCFFEASESMGHAAAVRGGEAM